MSTLGEEFATEQERCRELLIEYEKIGPAGAFGAVTIRMILKKADQAMAKNDLTEIVTLYEAMKGCK